MNVQIIAPEQCFVCFVVVDVTIKLFRNAAVYYTVKALLTFVSVKEIKV